MTNWTETTVTLPFMLSRAKARTNGEVWQIQTGDSIYPPDGRLDDFISELVEIRERLVDAEISFEEETDYAQATLRVTGWREIRENEKACLPSNI